MLIEVGRVSPRTDINPLTLLGIGLGLVTKYGQLPNNTVIAAVRDTTKAAAIKAIVPGSGSEIIVVKIDALPLTDPATAVASLVKHSITHLDVVIANAGIANQWGPGLTTPAEELESHFKVNTVGSLILFQAVQPLLAKSTGTPKFIAISTAIGSITDMDQFPLPSTAYGTSKAALNYLTRKLHFEHPDIIIYPISPGWVQTDMGSPTAKAMGMEDAPTTLEECVAGVARNVDTATREEQSGKFASFDDALYGW